MRWTLLAAFAMLLPCGPALASDPCELLTTAQIEKALGGKSVDIPTSEVGEETAPYCEWATKGSVRKIKVEYWSMDQLPVIDMPNARAYFDKLKADYANENVTVISDVGEAAFAAGFKPKAARSDGLIVVVKSGRTIVFWFQQINPVDATTFAATLIGLER